MDLNKIIDGILVFVGVQAVALLIFIDLILLGVI